MICYLNHPKKSLNFRPSTPDSEAVKTVRKLHTNNIQAAYKIQKQETTKLVFF